MKKRGLITLYSSFICICCSIIILCDLSFASNIDGTLKWIFRTNGQICSSPAIGRNGTTIYVGSNDKNLYAINLDGTLKWSFKTEGSLTGSPVIGNDNTIYIGTYAINPDGTLKWKGKADDIALSIDGTIYSSYSAAYAINPENGTTLWESENYAWCGSSPIVGEDGTIYYLTYALYALTPNGDYILGGYDVQTPTDFQESLPPIIDSNGTVFAVSSYKDGGLYAINQNDGTLKWKYEIGTRFGFIVIDKNGTLYSCSSKKSLHAINPDGSKKWTYYLNTSHNSSPAIGRDGTVFLSSSNDSTANIYAINPDGSNKWIFDIDNSYDNCNHISSPVIGSNGIIYVGGSNKLYAINTNCGGLADSCWPMIFHDMYHTRNVKTTIPVDFYTKEEVNQLIKRTLQKWDIDNDNKKGLAEAIDALKSIISESK